MQNVRGHIHTGHKIELLKDHGALRLPCARLAAPQRQYIATIDNDLTRGGIDLPVHHAQEGGFACAGTTDDPHEGGALNAEADVVDGGFLAEHPRHALNFKHRQPFFLGSEAVLTARCDRLRKPG